MRGIIIENIANLYKVKTEEGIVYEANARGKFKKDDITPVVGDFVECEVVKEDKEKDRVSIDKILDRKVYIKRPKIANISQIVLVVSSKHPKPDLLMLDKQLAFIEYLGIKALIVLNKTDLEQVISEDDDRLTSVTSNILKISALNKTGIEELYDKISEMFNLDEINLDNEVLITNLRHKNIISKAKENALNAKNALENNMPIDIIAIYIRQILDDLGEITGEVVTEDIINEIFSKFCLGK